MSTVVEYNLPTIFDAISIILKVYICIVAQCVSYASGVA